MKRHSVIFAAIVWLVAAVTPSPAEPLITVRSGHNAPVTALTWRSVGDHLFAAGEDGKLTVWDTASGRLLQSIRADQLGIRKMVIYPDGERVALYSSDGQRHRITVWNWRSGEREFLHAPEDEVLAMTVSDQETYLMYSMPSRQSVRVLDAETGRPLPFLRQETGIVSWMVIASSEERVMMYTPSTGRITYRTIVTGRSVAEFDAPRQLAMPSLLSTRRYAAARDVDGLLTVVDLLSGEVVDTATAGEIDSISVDTSDGEIVLLTDTFGGRRSIRRYRFAEGTLQQRYAPFREIPEDVTGIAVAGRGIYGGTRTGELLQWLPFEAASSLFAESILEPISDLYVTESQLHMLTAERVITISSDFFNEQYGATRETSFLRQSVIPLPIGEEGQFLPNDDGDLLLWTPRNSRSRLNTYRLGERQIDPIDFPVPGGLLDVDVYGDELLTLSRSGTLELRDRINGSLITSYRGRGLQTAIRTRRGVFIGKARQGLLDSAILRVNPDTGETVPLDTESDLVFALEFDLRRGRLFAIGVRSTDDGTISTVVEVFEGVAFDRRRTILEIPGEYLDAELIHDPVTGTAYTTLDDRGGILRWDGARISELLRSPAHIPRRVYLQGEFLYTLNRDGSVSVIDRGRGRPVIDFHVIEATNGAWVATRPDGRYLASSDVLAHSSVLSVNMDRETLDTRRLTIEERAIPQEEQEAERPLHRFDSAENEDRLEETEMFVPESGAPAPSS
jgi:WD40 repeat protein